MHLLISVSTFSMALKSSFMVMPYSSLPGMGAVEADDRGLPQAVRETSKKMMNKFKPALRNNDRVPIINKFCGFIVFLLIKFSAQLVCLVHLIYGAVVLHQE